MKNIKLYMAVAILLYAAVPAQSAEMASFLPAKVEHHRAATHRGSSSRARALPLEGAYNFRDLGGYRTKDGRSVRWGQLFRSGSLAGLSPKDQIYLGRLGIRSIIDFRTNEERRTAPNKWAETAHISYWARDYAFSAGDLNALSGSTQITPGQVRQMMIKAYRQMPYEQAPAYREMFRQLVAGGLPLLFNCTAGKDRTGVAAALVLSALGVPRKTIIADYVLTSRYLSPRAGGQTGHDMLFRLPADVAEPMLAAEPDYIEASLDEIARRHGSVRSYLRDILGVGPGEIRALRHRLLT